MRSALAPMRGLLLAAGLAAAAVAAAITVAPTAGCFSSKTNPRYCDEDTPCTDPDTPFCDLTGAYNPGDGHVYAVMVKAGLRHESISNFYVHLCYLLHPGSQECLEAFVEEAGVYGAAISDFEGVTHEASWRFEANEWRVTVEEDVETIRVIGPQQQG